MLRDARFGKGEPGPVWEQYELTEQEWQERFGEFDKRTRSMLSLDPPDHTRLRKLVAKAFTPRTVEKLRPDIVRLTDELLDRFDGVVDVIPELALQLPISGHRRDARCAAGASATRSSRWCGPRSRRSSCSRRSRRWTPPRSRPAGSSTSSRT